MTHVPDWTELYRDALTLSQTQRECYVDVHTLLDIAIPDLDRKLAELLNKPYPYPNVSKLPQKPTYEYVGIKQAEQQRDSEPPRVDDNIDFNSLEVEHDDTWADVDSALPPHKPISSPSLIDVDSYNERDTESDTIVVEEVTVKNRHGCQDPEDELLKLQRHALPMPISEYLKINRPTVVRRADCRRMYIRRRKHERRKASASSRIISGFQKIRISPQKSQEGPRRSLKSYTMPEYQVECKLSEHEMRRLTNKIYRRLPEVVRRKHDEINNYLRIQNYKNKKEYGRKLLENRRHGIINYPLRHNYDSRSLDSGHDDSLSSGERAADSLKSDPYY